MGEIVISVDAELAWGFHDQACIPFDRVETARNAWHLLLELFDKYDVPATWAVVGHLMLDECDGNHHQHPTLPGWFDRDPGGQVTANSFWMAPDLVEAIQGAPVNHELASHTFSHVPFGKNNLSEDIVDAELASHRRIADEWDESLDTLVFPRNQVGFRDRIAAHGFGCYRGTSPNSWYDQFGVGRAGKAFDLVGARTTPPLVEPTVDEHGLVNVPASLDIFGFEGLARRLTEPVIGDPIVDAAKRGINATARQSGVFHMWLHPNNIKDEADIRRMQTIVQHIHDRDVPVKTMRDVAASV